MSANESQPGSNEPLSAIARTPALEPFLESARNVLGAGSVLTDTETLEFYSVDFSETRLADAAAVVKPSDADEVEQLVKLANSCHVPLVPRGASMSYTLGTVPAKAGSVIVDMSRMNRILRIDQENLHILVEAGVTWAQIHEALSDSDYFIPFIGTLSGTRATVGGGLGNWAVGWGKGDISEYLLGVEVVLGDGRLTRTGALSANFEKPGLTCFGPELTRLFVNDAGAFGIKTKACFRLERRPAGTAYASWGFANPDDALEFMCEVARSGTATDCFVFGEYHHKVFMNQPRPAGADMRTLLKRVVANSSSRRNACRNLLALLRSGRFRFLGGWTASVHVAVDGASQHAADASMKPLRRAARRFKANRLPGGFMIATRARPFGPIDDLIVGREGECSLPSNCTVALSQGMALKSALDAFFEDNERYMNEHGITHTRLCLAIRNTFGIEPIIYWKDRMNPLRRSILNPEREKLFGEQPANAKAREAALHLRERMVREVFMKFQPVHAQIGKYYPFRERLEGGTEWEVLESLKAAVDPQRLLNPGALGLD